MKLQNSLISTSLPHLWKFLVEVAQTSKLVIPVKVKTLRGNSGQMVCLTNCSGESDAKTQEGYHTAFAIQVLNFREHRGGYRLIVLHSPISLSFQLVTAEGRKNCEPEQWRPPWIWREEATLEPVMNYPDCRLNLGTLRGSKRKMASTLATRDLKYKWNGGTGQVLGPKGPIILLVTC